MKRQMTDAIKQELGRLYLEASNQGMAFEAPVGTAFEDFLDRLGGFVPPAKLYEYLRDQEIVVPPQSRTAFAFAMVPPGLVRASRMVLYVGPPDPAAAAVGAFMGVTPPEFLFQIFLAPPSREFYNDLVKDWKEHVDKENA